MYIPPQVIGPIEIEVEHTARIGTNAKLSGHIQDAIESWHTQDLRSSCIQLEHAPAKQYLIVDGVVYINSAFIKENTL